MRKISLGIIALIASLGMGLVVVGCSSSSGTPKDKMAADKMSADKMSGDKMHSDKMHSDKMATDKMSTDKMAGEKKDKM